MTEFHYHSNVIVSGRQCNSPLGPSSLPLGPGPWSICRLLSLEALNFSGPLCGGLIVQDNR
jgi:hypothetical protein